MNKRLLTITQADVKRCDAAIKAFEKLARGSTYESALRDVQVVTDYLQRLRWWYAGAVGVTLVPGDARFYPTRTMICFVRSFASLLYAFGYTEKNYLQRGEWRAVILKVTDLAEKRLEVIG